MGGISTVANFIAYYSDETQASHCLTLDTYGDMGEREDGRWLLLEPIEPVPRGSSGGPRGGPPFLIQISEKEWRRSLTSQFLNAHN